MTQAKPSDILISVVIPTKDRYETLFPTVAAITAGIADTRLQVIVQDNTTDNARARSFFSELADPRVHYAHLPLDVSIVENTEAALDLATGSYITFIGDDDLVSPHILSIAEALADANIEAATYIPAYYWWTSVKFTHPSRFHQPGACWYPLKTSATVKMLDPEVELARVKRQGAVSLFNLPKLYHGIVHRDALTRLKAVTGRYVNGASPDMALAVGLSAVLKRHAHLEFPLTIYGASRNSGGGWTAESKHQGRIEEQKHLPRATVDGWNPKLPRIWSEHTIYPQTAVEVLRAMSLKDDLDYASFYASMAVNEPHLRAELMPLITEHLRDTPVDIARFVTFAALKIAGRGKRALQKQVFGFPYELKVLPTVDKCMDFLRTRAAPDFRASLLHGTK
jgi:glycosyltransferase involved in cell wall biosynthesis